MNEQVVISMIKLRKGVDPQRFSEFAASVDLPTWRKKDVVIGFNTYRVAQNNAHEPEIEADFVEVMHLRSLAAWEQVGATDPEIAPLAARFTELVDESQVRCIHVTSVESP